MTRPLVVVEGSARSYANALIDVRRRGWRVVEGWTPDPRADVRAGTVTSFEDAANALLAAVGGAGVVLHARADRDVVDRLCDDLRRLGPLEHRVGDHENEPRLTHAEEQLLELLAEGLTLGAAAARLTIGRRTADRRLAAARTKLGVRTTAEALVRFAQSTSS